MSRYETYKPSGIDWIGNYPKNWEFRRLKNVCIVNKEALSDKTPFDYLIEYIDIGNTTDNGEFLELQEIEFSEAPSRARRKVEDGDTIISTVRTYLRAIAFIEKPKENLIVSTGFAVLNPIKRTLVPKFLFYQVLCDSFIQRVIANSEGVSYPAISSTKLADLKLFIPSIEEQLAIANYLDDQTQKIDRLIANKKTQTEKLKELRQIEINNAVTKGLNPNAEMKDSGIEWLGKTPKHWSEKRLKNLVSPKITDGPHETPELVDDIDGIPFISAEAITENGINYEARGGNISVEQDKIYSLKCKPKRDDIFMVKSGSTTGRIGYVDTDLNFNIWSPLALIRANSNTNSRFLYFALCSNYIQKQVQLTWSFGTQPNIGMGVIERLRLVIPPKEEQVVIAEYLMQRTTAIVQLIKNIEVQIEKLQELRKIKIYEAVTGKIKVNAYAETTA